MPRFIDDDAGYLEWAMANPQATFSLGPAPRYVIEDLVDPDAIEVGWAGVVDLVGDHPHDDVRRGNRISAPFTRM